MGIELRYDEWIDTAQPAESHPTSSVRATESKSECRLRHGRDFAPLKLGRRKQYV